jgi:hypothetical protein
MLESLSQCIKVCGDSRAAQLLRPVNDSNLSARLPKMTALSCSLEFNAVLFHPYNATRDLHTNGPSEHSADPCLQ